MIEINPYENETSVANENTVVFGASQAAKALGISRRSFFDNYAGKKNKKGVVCPRVAVFDGGRLAWQYDIKKLMEWRD